MGELAVPLVSVLVAVYNEELFVEEMVSGIIEQDYTAIELIVVNDGSTDRTIEILHRLCQKYEWIKVINFPENRGKCASQNAAFAASSGEFIAIHGGDDVSRSSRLSRQVKFMTDNGLDACITEMRTIDEKGCVILSNYGTVLKPTNCHLKLVKGNSFPAGTLMFSRKIAEKIYPIPEKLTYEDRWITYKVQKTCSRVGFIHDPLYDYRQHSGNSYLVKRGISLREYIYAVRKMSAREHLVDVAILADFDGGPTAEMIKAISDRQAFERRLSGQLSARDIVRAIRNNNHLPQKLFYLSPFTYFLAQWLKIASQRQKSKSDQNMREDEIIQVIGSG
jgi:alpha-1,3-rhamnosyltransferase